MIIKIKRFFLSEQDGIFFYYREFETSLLQVIPRESYAKKWLTKKGGSWYKTREIKLDSPPTLASVSAKKVASL